MTTTVTTGVVGDLAISAAKIAADAIETAKLKAANVTADKMAAGAVVQVVNTQTGAMATGTALIPLDDTIPQNTEGDQYMSVSITPTSATSKLLIQVVAHLANSQAGYNMIGALFQDSTANALATAKTSVSAAGQMAAVVINHYMTAGTTSATTFKFRAGSNTAGTTTFNGAAGAAQFGGTYASSITITEIKA